MGIGPINSEMYNAEEEAGAPNVRFYRHKVFMNPEDRGQAIEDGRMKAEDSDYIECDFIEIVYPGNRLSVYNQPVKLKATGSARDDLAHPDRFPREWDAYQNRVAGVSGTPLESMGLNQSDVSHLDKFDILSVENLAGLTDTAVLIIGNGIGRYRDMARAWQTANRKPVIDEVAQSQIDVLTAQLAEMRAMVEGMQPKRGRPAKLEDTHADSE